MKTIHFLFLGGLTAAAASNGAPAFPELLFEENLGQTEVGVRYVARAQGHTVFLRGDEVVFAPPAGAPVRLQFPGARGGRWEALGGARDTISYFTGADSAKWVRGARQFGRVAWREAYPGIDIVFHSAGRRLEYDLVVKPGADPGAVRVRFVGAEARLEADGSIAAGAVRQRAPRIFDANGKTVAGRFVSNGTREFRLELGAYDREVELTIDPVVETYAVMGGENDDEIKVVTDFFVAGNTRSVAFVDGQWARRRSRDVFVRGVPGPFTLFGSRESFLGTIVYGGSDDDEIGGAAGANSQFVCILAGTTKSTDLPLATNSYQGGASDGFAVRIRTTGSFGRPTVLDAMYFGGTGEDRIHAIAWNGSSLYAFAGVTDSTDLKTMGSSWSVPGGGKNVFAGLISTFGAPTWSLGYLGGDGDDAGYAVTFQAINQVVIGGETSSANFPFVARESRGRSGPSDGFLTMVTTTSLLEPGQSFALAVPVPFSATTDLVGGNGADSVRAVTIGARRNDQFDRLLPAVPVAQTGIGFAGATSSTDLATPGAFQTTIGGGSDGFAGVWEPTRRAPRWVSYVGGSGEDSIHAAAMNWFGDLIVGGQTTSGDLRLVDAAQKAPGGGEDGVFAMFERGGGARHVTYWGGAGDDRIYAVSALGGRTARAGGVTNSPGYRPALRNSDESEGGAEGFVASIGSHYFSGPDEIILPKDGALTAHFRTNITQPSLPVSYRSADPSKVRVVRLGVSSAEATIPAEDGVLVEALTDSGEVELIVTAPGHREKAVRVRLYPGVFEFPASSQPVSLIAGGTTVNTFIRYAAYDEAVGRTVGAAGLRPGIRMPAIRWRSTDPEVLSPNPPPSDGISTFVAFTTNRPGEARLTAEVEGFRVLDGPVYSVQTYRFRLAGGDVFAAKDLQRSLPLNTSPARAVTLTAKSGDPSKVLVARTDMFEGAESVSLVHRDFRSPWFAVYALADSGEVPITVSGPELESDVVFTVKLEPAAVRCGLTSFRGLSLEDLQVSAGQEATFGCQFQGANSRTPGAPMPDAPATSFELENSDPAVLELGSIRMDQNQQTSLRGIAAGTVSIRARELSGRYRIENDTVPVRVTEAVVEVRAPKTVEIGKDLQSAVWIQMVNVAGPVELSVTSSDPSALLVSDSERATGSAQIVLRLGGGGENLLWLQGLKSSGTATVTVRYAGAPPQTIEVTLLPSAIAAIGPSGAASVAAGYDTLLAVSPFVVDDVTGQRLARQLLRPGMTVEVKLRLEGAGARLSADTVQIGASGVAYLSAAYPPAGQEAEVVASGSGEFGEAAASRFRLRRPALDTAYRLDPIAVAEHAIQQHVLHGVSGAGMSVASGDPSRLLLSLQPDSEPLPRLASVTSSQTIYLHGLASSGVVDLTVFAGEEARHITRVLLQPLAFAIGGFVPPAPTEPPSRLTVGLASGPLLRSGAAPFGVAFRSSDERVFRVSPDRATLRPGATAATVTVTPVAPGTAEFIVTPDDGAPIASPATMQIALREPRAEPREILLGKNLQTEVPIRMTAPAPPSGAILTVTSTDPSKVLVSRSNAPGSVSTVLAVAPGARDSQPVYVQALSDSGVVALRVTGAGLAESTITVRLAQANVVFNTAQTLARAGTPFQAGVQFAIEGTAVSFAARAGGPSSRVRIISSDPAVAEPAGEVTVPGFFAVQAKAAGTATLRVETPEGFAGGGSAMPVTVALASVRASCAQGIFLGKDTQLTCTIESPTGTAFTATSLHPSLALVSATADAAGAAQATVTRSFTVQALASRGTTAIALTAPGVESTRISVVLRPVRLSAFSTNQSGPNQLRLFPGENSGFSAQISVAASNSSPIGVRAGARMTVATEFSTAGVASITPAQIELNGGESSKAATIRGLAAGTTLLRVRPPEGVEFEGQPLQITVR
jgi:hypothetical protein